MKRHTLLASKVILVLVDMTVISHLPPVCPGFTYQGSTTTATWWLHPQDTLLMVDSWTCIMVTAAYIPVHLYAIVVRMES